MNIIAKLKQIREELRNFYSTTLIDIAKNHGAPVEFCPALPVCIDGFLDRHESPRFIAVNSTLDQVAQSYAISREVSRLRQERRFNSVVLNSAKRWHLLDDAPPAVKKQICNLDLEHRALMMFGMWGKPAEYWLYHKRNPSKIFRTGRITFITDLLFLQLRARKFLYQISRSARVANGVSQ